MTVTGDLFVNGSTTQVNTASLLVEDRTIELGLVDGSAPSSATTWDLGILFNYHSSGAKEAAVAWETNDGRFKFASAVTADADGTGSSNPQITFTTMAHWSFLLYGLLMLREQRKPLDMMDHKEFFITSLLMVEHSKVLNIN